MESFFNFKNIDEDGSFNIVAHSLDCDFKESFI